MTKINELNPTTAAATTKSNAVIIKNESFTAPKSSTLTNHTGYPLLVSTFNDIAAHEPPNKVVLLLQLPPDSYDANLKFLGDGSELRISYTWSEDFSRVVENMTNNAYNVNSFAMIISMNAYIAQLKEEIGSRKLTGFLNITLPFECEENMDYASVTAISPTIIQIVLLKKLTKNTKLSFGFTTNG